METKSFEGFEDTRQNTAKVKANAKVNVRPTLKKCPVCNTKHYEPTNVCKLCKEKH